MVLTSEFCSHSDVSFHLKKQISDLLKFFFFFNDLPFISGRESCGFHESILISILAYWFLFFLLHSTEVWSWSLFDCCPRLIEINKINMLVLYSVLDQFWADSVLISVVLLWRIWSKFGLVVFLRGGLYFNMFGFILFIS